MHLSPCIDYVLQYSVLLIQWASQMSILNTGSIWIVKHESRLYFLMGVTASDTLDASQLARQLKVCNFSYSIGVTGLYFLSLRGWTLGLLAVEQDI